MQTQSSDENSVCPSINRVDCDKTEERSVQIFIPYERAFSLLATEFCEIRQSRGYYAVQGHSRLPSFVLIESSHAASYNVPLIL